MEEPPILPPGTPPTAGTLPPAFLPGLVTQAAYGVMPAEEAKYGPCELYFWRLEEWKGPIPPEQDNAMQAFNEFASVMRQALVADPNALDLYYKKLCTAACATFNAFGFHPEGLRQLETYKKEIVRLVGPKLRSTYLKQLRNVALCICAAILFSAFGVDRLVQWYSARVVVQSASANASSTGETNASGVVSDAGSGANPKGSIQAEKSDAMKSEQSATPSSTSAKMKKILFSPSSQKLSVLNLGILLAASMIGLLFSSISRGMNLTFEELLTPMDDLLPPWIKFTFYGIAIFILGAFFQLQWLTVSVGGNSFSTAIINESPAAALLFGLLLGIAERAVPERVIKLAADVANSKS